MKYAVYLEDIGEESLLKLTRCILFSYEGLINNEADFTWRMEHASRSIEILFTILEEKKIFSRNRKPYFSWVNILISAVYIYFAVKNRLRPDNFIELFEIRQNFAEHAERNQVNASTFDVLCQAIEAANGNSGVPNCKPVPGTPTELMALAIFFEQKILPTYDGTKAD